MKISIPKIDHPGLYNESVRTHFDRIASVLLSLSGAKIIIRDKRRRKRIHF